MKYEETNSNNIYIKLNELYFFRSDCLEAKVENINFKTKVKNCLIKNKIITLRELLDMNIFEIAKLRGAGKNTCDSILLELDKLNFIYKRLSGPKYISETIDLFCEFETINKKFSIEVELNKNINSIENKNLVDNKLDELINNFTVENIVSDENYLINEIKIKKEYVELIDNYKSKSIKIDANTIYDEK